MGDFKYKAFISYSHADEPWGAWLQRSLERFRAPRQLARRAPGEPDLVLAPVFRDREDLPVAGNLNEAIQKALGASEHQIVLCSPNAARSRWVNEEIKLFHRLHGPGRTFAIIVGGEPGGGADDECFPPALRFRLDADGEVTDEPAEPLAADARAGGDGKRYALLKTAAGMLGVGLDDLVRRDAQRRARRARVIAAGTSGIAASMTFAAIYAFNQRNQAQIMRGKAETLVEFMLTDLSDRLEPVGKLDILQEVGGEVLDYYADQDIKSLDPAALSRRAQALMKLGQVDQRRGDLDAALSAYEAAFASTEEQLRRAPNDADRIFDHAQSVFYVGNVAVERGDFERGEQAFKEYYRLAQRLVGFDDANPKWRLEVAYATNNLGALEFSRGSYAASLPYFAESADIRRALAIAAPHDRKIAFAHASALSWQAYAQIAVGDFALAIETLQRQLAIYDAFEGDALEEDYESLEKRITAERRLSEAHLALGDLTSARAATERAATIGRQLLVREPGNANSQANVAIIEMQRSRLFGLEGDKAGELAAARRGVEIARSVLQRDPAQLTGKLNLGSALIRLVTADPALCAAPSRELEGLLGETATLAADKDLDFFASGMLALTICARAEGDAGGAQARAAVAVDSLHAVQDRLTASSRKNLAHLLAEAGDAKASAAVADELFARGVRQPDLMALRARLASAQTP